MSVRCATTSAPSRPGGISNTLASSNHLISNPGLTTCNTSRPERDDAGARQGTLVLAPNRPPAPQICSQPAQTVARDQGDDVRLAVLGAFIIVVGAAILSIRGSAAGAGDTTQFATTLVLAAAVGVQRLNGVQKWLSGPRDQRKIHTERLAQETLIRLCESRVVADDILGIRVHVWGVPPWYRRVFHHSLRKKLRGLAQRRGLTWLAWLKIRPKLQRLAAIGLVKEPPSSVRFSMGKGLIGVCLLNNDRGDTLKLRTTDRAYTDALNSATEKEWVTQGPEITHNLSLADARKLASLYKQVISKVVQDQQSGEAIGVVTISVKDSNPRIGNQQLYLNNLRNLALTVGDII